jgi:hypothetical protein
LTERRARGIYGATMSDDGTTAPTADPIEPPTVEALGRFTSPAGDRSARLDIAGIAIELEGLPDDLADAMAAHYAPFIGPTTGAGAPLRIQVRDAPVDHFIAPDIHREWERYRVLTRLEAGVFRSVSYRFAAWFDVGRGVGQMALARGDRDPAPRAMENFLRGAVAWLAMERGGLFLHGAGIVRRGRAYLFFGPSGAGKSTLADLSAEGDVISDDLVLVLKTPDGLRAAGAPFRGTYLKRAPVVGLFPLAGFYRLRKDDRILVRPGDGACFADLLGNLPWVVDQLVTHPNLIDRVRALVEETPMYYLHFRKDEDFWPAIDAGS